MEDSKIIQDWYRHPAEGQGVFVMIDAEGLAHWCHSGNELRRVHELNPDDYLTGPVYLNLSNQDYDRLTKWTKDLVDSW